MFDLYDGHGTLVDWAELMASDKADVMVVISMGVKDAFASLPTCRHTPSAQPPCS